MKRTLAIISAAALLATQALNFGPMHPRSAHAATTLTVWEDFSAPEETAMTALAKKWAAGNGTTITFVNTSQPGRGGQQISGLFPLKARSSAGPDLIFVPQDQTGQFAAGGLLATRPAGLLSASDQALYQPAALGSTLLNGIAYSVPHTVDGTFLFYNKKLVAHPPTTWTDLISQAKALTKGGQYGLLIQLNQIYFDYFAFSSYGAYIFGTKNGKFDTTDIGLANPGAVKAAAFLASLAKQGLVPPSTDFNAMSSNFTAGKAGMIIDGPWDIASYGKALGDNLGVASIPALPGGGVARPMIGVRVWEVNAFSKNQAMAWDLAKYLSLNGETLSANLEGRLPALKAPAGYTPTALQKAAAKQFAVGIPIPNVPEMGQVWTPMQTALTLVVTGRSTPDKALSSGVQQIKAGIAKMQNG